MRKLFYTLALSCALVAGVTCVALAPNPSGSTYAETSPLRVKNNSDDMVRVYVSENGNSPWRITQVDGLSTVTVSMRVHSGSRYTFILKPLAGFDTYTTPDIDPVPNEPVFLDIEKYLPLSTVWR